MPSKNSGLKGYFNNKNLKRLLIILGILVAVVIIFNLIIMPWYVSADEVTVPKVIGLSEAEAQKSLSDFNLEPINGGERYNEKYPKGTVIFQKPSAGSMVKEGRRIFLFVSSGIPMVKVPSLKGKNLRDARYTLERMELALGDTIKVESPSPRDIIIDQQYYEGTEIKKGTKINVTISTGQKTGISVPDLLGKSLNEAELIITGAKLKVGKINYQPSISLLPNTVIDQYPSKDNVVQEDTEIDLFVTKNVPIPNEVEGNK